MDFSQLKRNLAECVKPCYCIYGEDVFLKTNALKQLRARVENPAMNISVYSNDERLDWTTIISELNTMPWGSEYRLVIVQNPKQIELVQDYLRNPNSRAILAIYFESGTPPKAVLDIAEPIICNKLDAQYCIRYVQQMGNERGTEIEAEACRLLVEYADGDMSTIINEAEKLFSSVLGGVVTIEMVKQSVAPKAEYIIFDLSDAVLTRNHDKTFMLLKELRRNGVDAYSILATLSISFRRLLHLQLHQDADEREVAAKLGVKPTALYHMRGKLKNFTVLELFKIVEVLSEAEYKAKSGQVNANSQIETLIAQIITNFYRL